LLQAFEGGGMGFRGDDSGLQCFLGGPDREQADIGAGIQNHTVRWADIVTPAHENLPEHRDFSAVEKAKLLAIAEARSQRKSVVST